MTRFAQRFLGNASRSPLLQLLVGAAGLLAVAEGVSAARGSGPVAALAFSTEANLTYGPLLAIAAGVTLARQELQLRDVWHGLGWTDIDRFLIAMRSAVVVALLVRLATSGGLMLGGLIREVSGAATSGAAGLHASGLLLGQSRLAVVYVLAAALGALLGWAVPNGAAAGLIAAAATLVYTPAVGALANRAPQSLDVLPYLPFGALRGLFSGNGAVFGNDPQQARQVGTGAALVGFGLWMTVLVVLAASRSRVSGVVARARSGPLLGALAFPVLIGAFLPAALAGTIPWQWQPSWKHAQDAGWDSRQVTQRWLQLLRDPPNESRLSELYASSEKVIVPPEVSDAVRRATSMHVQPVSEMQFPYWTRVDLRFSPALRSGNVIVTRAQVQLTFELTHDRWLISSVAGPSISASVS